MPSENSLKNFKAYKTMTGKNTNTLKQIITSKMELLSHKLFK